MVETITPKKKIPVIKIALGIITLLVIGSVLFLKFYKSSVKTTEVGKVVETKQTQAAVESGSDAVNTFAGRIITETRTTTITKENTRDIEALNTTSPTFPDDLQRAGIAGLCRYDVYSNDPRCVQ